MQQRELGASCCPVQTATPTPRTAAEPHTHTLCCAPAPSVASIHLHLLLCVHRGAAPQGRRKLVVEPIVMPSLKHCGVAVDIDVHSAGTGKVDRSVLAAAVRGQRGVIAAHSVRKRSRIGEECHCGAGWRGRGGERGAYGVVVEILMVGYPLHIHE